MQSVAFHQPSTAAISEIARPELTAPDDAILLVTTAAVGPWDLAAYSLGLRGVTPGAQFAGIVVETGPEVRSVSIDDLVVSTAALPSGQVFGSRGLAGGHAEYVRVPMADRTLVKTTPAAEERTVFAGGSVGLGIQAAETVLSYGDAGDAPEVLFWGCDTAAIAALAWLKWRTRGALTPFAFDRAATLASLAKSYGARVPDSKDIAGLSPHAVIVGSSAQEANLGGIPRALREIPHWIFSDPVADFESVSLSLKHTPRRCHWPTHEETRAAALAVQLRQIDLTQAVSHVMPLDQAALAYRQALELPPGTRAVLLKP